MEEQQGIEVTSEILDAADHFASLVTQMFSPAVVIAQLTFHPIWRPMIVFRVHEDAHIEHLENFCQCIQSNFYWNSGILIGYFFKRGEDD